ncbi:MAG: DMT family transporter, partial [Hyphomicrobiales bacterium]|nr:DMT family transporter [Hyphomicrobiales bacterium]
MSARAASRGASQGASGRAAAFAAAAPWAFVLLWSTGWIVARYSAAYADPLTFLAVRFAGALAAMGAIALATRAAWPRRPAAIGHALLSGALIHATYLGGVWTAVRHGLPASISALLAATQPLATAALAPRLLGERMGGRAK